MKQKDFLTILVPLFLLTVLWVIFNIYHNYVSSTITDPLTVQIMPIEGNFDVDAVDKIKTRQRVEPIYDVQQNETSPTPTPATEVGITNETASNSAEELITPAEDENL